MDDVRHECNPSLLLTVPEEILHRLKSSSLAGFVLFLTMQPSLVGFQALGHVLAAGGPLRPPLLLLLPPSYLVGGGSGGGGSNLPPSRQSYSVTTN